MKKYSLICYFKELGGTVMLFVSLLILVGCDKSIDSDIFRVGVVSGPEVGLMEVAAEILANEAGIKVKVVEFSDYITPNIALSDGSIDANIFQHRPYMTDMVKNHGFKLAVVGNTFLFPIGVYSRKIKSIADLKDRAVVAIPNDPSNEGRALILLHNSGIITLKNINNLNAVPSDIVKNPKSLKFVELEAAQLSRALDDVDLAIINSTYSVSVGLLPSRDALLIEKIDSPYMNIIVSREDNKEDPSVLALVKAYQTKAVEKEAIKLFNGSLVVGW